MTDTQDARLREWLPKAQKMARAFARHNPRMDPDDVESAAMMAVVEAVERYDGSTPFDVRCRFAVKRRVLDAVRRYFGRSGRPRRGKSVATAPLYSDYSDSDKQPLVDYVTRDQRAVSLCDLQPADWLEAAAADMWPRERKFLRLRLEGYTIEEAAAAVGLGQSMGCHLWQAIAAHLAKALGRPERATAVANCFKKLR